MAPRRRPGPRGLAVPLAAAVVLATGCTGGAGRDPPDAGTPLGPTTWDPGLPSTGALPMLRGKHEVRGIMHLHSPYSHDACDGKGYLGDGKIDEPCLADLRYGACKTKQDFLLLSDHPAWMASQPFTALLLMRDHDVPAGDHAAWWICPDGHRILVEAGFEHSLIGFALHRPLANGPSGNTGAYDAHDAAEATTIRVAGGLVAQSHPEEYTVDSIRALEPDATEIYNLHANVDPNIRKDFLGVSSTGAISALAPFIFTPDKAPIPDLAFLGFFQLFDAEVTRWYAVSMDRPTLGYAATDAHENIIPQPLADGERGDSYRRLMRWFSNHVWIQGALTPVSLDRALRARRAYLAFEVFGTPSGVDFTMTRGTEVHGIGEVVQGASGLTFHAALPTCLGGFARGGPAPKLTVTVYRVTGPATAPQRRVVATGPGALEAKVPGPGMYYEEVDLVPTHLERWLGPDPDAYLHTFPWVITNAITVE